MGKQMLSEFPEQLLSVRYVEPEDVVLEIGSNVGRNTLIISKILNDSSNLVTLEANKNDHQKLVSNLASNGSKAIAINAALSKQRLALKGLRSYPIEEAPKGAVEIPTIKYEDLPRRDFNVLILDCEGAFYLILKTYPQILDRVRKILVENNYSSLEQYKYVDEELKKRRFSKVYSGKLTRNVDMPCRDRFYEVYIR